jgi:hypothetical protein
MFVFLGSRSTRRHLFATFIGTYVSTSIRITPTSIIALSRCFASMALRISSSGSGTPGKRKVEPAGTRTRTRSPPQSTRTSCTDWNALRTPLGRSRKTRRLPTTAHPLLHPHATRLRTFRTKGGSRHGHLEVPTSPGWNPRQRPALTLPSFQLLRLPLHRLRILFRTSITPHNNLTCLMILQSQTLPLHHRHLYIYHLAQRMSQESPDLHPVPLNPWPRPSPPPPSSYKPPLRMFLLPRSTFRSRLRTRIQASQYTARS